MSEPAQAQSFLYWLGQAVVVGVGWVVVHVLSANRDLDKSRRETIVTSADAISDDVAEILVKARTYHATPRETPMELELKMAIQDVAIKVNALSDIYSDQQLLANCRSQILALRRAITSQHFEDEHVLPLTASDSQYQLMAESALELKRGLLKIKNRQFTKFASQKSR